MSGERRRLPRSLFCELPSYLGRVGGERRLGIDCLRDHSQKNLGIRLRLELSVKSIRIRPVYFHIIKRYSCLPVELPSTPMNVEDNHRVYEAKDALLAATNYFR